MNIIVFAIFWVAEQTIPTAQFVSSFESMKECNATIAAVKDPAIRKNLSCIQVVGVSPTSSKGL